MADSKVRNLNAPFGFDQGDPLIVCINDTHMRKVQEAFQLKGYYCSHGAAITGRRFSKAIVFRPLHLSSQEETRFRDWIRECVATGLEVGGEIFYV